MKNRLPNSTRRLRLCKDLIERLWLWWCRLPQGHRRMRLRKLLLELSWLGSARRRQWMLRVEVQKKRQWRKRPESLSKMLLKPVQMKPQVGWRQRRTMWRQGLSWMKEFLEPLQPLHCKREVILGWCQ
jgi:hypothetical protein